MLLILRVSSGTWAVLSCSFVLMIVSNNLAVLGYARKNRSTVEVLMSSELTAVHFYSSARLGKLLFLYFPDHVKIWLGCTPVCFAYTEEKERDSMSIAEGGDLVVGGRDASERQSILFPHHFTSVNIQMLFKTSLNLVAQSILHFHLKWLIMASWYLKLTNLSHF